MTVYLLSHAHEDDEYRDYEKLVGVYSTQQNAEDAQRRLSIMPGFKDHPAGFEITEITLDKDSWEEGFISWDEASPPPPGSPQYETLIGSDLERDGMFLELREIGKEASPLLEIFYSDGSRRMTLTAFSQGIELGLAEDAISEAKRRLPPRDRAEGVAARKPARP